MHQRAPNITLPWLGGRSFAMFGILSKMWRKTFRVEGCFSFLPKSLLFSSPWLEKVVPKSISFLEHSSAFVFQKVRFCSNEDIQKLIQFSFPCSSVSKESACSAEDLGSIPGWGRSPGEDPLQYSYLGNPIDREPGGLQSMGPQGISHYWVTNTFNIQAKS